MPTITVTLDRDKTVTLKYEKVTFTLHVDALADTSVPSVIIRLDGTSYTIPGAFSLAPGTYTITAPDEIIHAGEVYKYSTYTEA